MVTNVSSEQVWQALGSDPRAQLVDVRCDAEWAFVGIPDLSSVNKQPILIAWQTYPTMHQNPAFVDDLRRYGLTEENHIYFLCRSGARSQMAAMAAKAAGFGICFNIVDGFEGPPNENGHRGEVAGWKAAGLPWNQR